MPQIPNPKSLNLQRGRGLAELPPGYSHGCVVAHQMACQLEEVGGVLFSGTPPYRSPNYPEKVQRNPAERAYAILPRYPAPHPQKHLWSAQVLKCGQLFCFRVRMFEVNGVRYKLLREA